MRMSVPDNISIRKTKMLKSLFFVGLGSCCGGMARYLLSRWVQQLSLSTFPFGTMAVNILGCFAIGIFYALFEQQNLMNTYLKLFLTVGFCGGFTTFSTFINENYLLVKDGNFISTIFYMGGSVFLGFIMLYLGYWLVRELAGF